MQTSKHPRRVLVLRHLFPTFDTFCDGIGYQARKGEQESSRTDSIFRGRQESGISIMWVLFVLSAL